MAIKNLRNRKLRQFSSPSNTGNNTGCRYNLLHRCFYRKKVISYTLWDNETEQKVFYDPNTLRFYMKHGVLVSGLKLTSNNRIIKVAVNE